MICERCFQPLDQGEHGQYLCPFEPRPCGLAIIDDQLEGGPRRFETMGDDAPYIETKSQWKREAEARGLISVGDRKPASYFAKQRKLHDECIKDTGVTLDGLRVRES